MVGVLFDLLLSATETPIQIIKTYLLLSSLNILLNTLILMEKKKATDFIQKLLVSNEGKKPDQQLQRKDIVDILVVDHKIPESTAYRYFADALREYEWEQEKSGDPTRIDKNKKVLDQVWDIAQDAILNKKDQKKYLETIQIWSQLSTRFKKL